MSTRKSSRVPKPSAVARASNTQTPKLSNKRKQTPKSTGSKQRNKRGREAPAEQIADNGSTDQPEDNLDEGNSEEQNPSMAQQMRSMLQDMLPEILRHAKEVEEEDRPNQLERQRAENIEDDQEGRRRKNQGNGNAGNLPKAGELAWKKFGARLAVSVGVVAQAIVTGLAVAATAQFLSSSKVEDGALLLMAENSEDEVTHLAVYQLSIDSSVKRLARVAASYVEGQSAEEQTRKEKVKVLSKFKGYWLSEESWEEVQLLKEEEYFWGVELTKKPWFPSVELSLIHI